MDSKTGLWVYYESDDQYDKSYGFKDFLDIEDVEKFINDNPNWFYKVIWGTEYKVKQVTTVTKLEIYK